MPDELKPCPWCGEKPDMVKRNYMYHFICENPMCFVNPISQSRSTVNELVAAWNTREEVRDDG